MAQLAEPTKTPGPGSSSISTIPELEAATVEPLRVPGCGEESLASLQAAGDQKHCRAADLKSAQQNMRFVLTCDPYSPKRLRIQEVTSRMFHRASAAFRMNKTQFEF